jgi:3-hydroxyisobutyrate dehydrogenase
MNEQLRVGFVGVGDQGGPMAEGIIKNGWPTSVFARRSEVRDHFAALGATIAPSLRALGASSDLVSVCVVNDDQVRDVLLGDDGVLAGMDAGGVVAIHSTIQPRTCKEIASAAASRQVSVVDAPVSGGPVGAREGTLVVMVGGDQTSFDRCRPVFGSFSQLVRLVGPLGSGQKLKLFNSYMNTFAWFGALETRRILSELEIDLDTAGEFLFNSTATTGPLRRLIKSKWGHAEGGVPQGESASLALREKDVGYFRAVAEDEEIDLIQLDRVVGLGLTMYTEASAKNLSLVRQVLWNS